MDSSQRDQSKTTLGGASQASNKNVEFTPLSQLQPTVDVMMPLCNPVDQFVPEKFSTGHEVVLPKDIGRIIPKTEAAIATACRQVRHANAITIELKLLLEHEQKILEQVVTRIDKFKNLRDENKEKATNWENEYKKMLPEYDSYMTKLVNVPQSQNITVEGLPAPVQQKILYQIVSRTSNTADRVVLQLSLEQTVANDIDMTLGGLKKNCTVLLKRIRGWLKMLNTLECQQNLVMERWKKFKNIIKDMRVKSDRLSIATIGSTTGGNMENQLKPYDDRIKRLEDAICKLGGPSYCSTEAEKSPGPNQTRSAPPQGANTPPQGANTPPQGANTPQGGQEERLKRIEDAICQIYSMTCIAFPGPQVGIYPGQTNPDVSQVNIPSSSITPSPQQTSMNPSSYQNPAIAFSDVPPSYYQTPPTSYQPAR